MMAIKSDTDLALTGSREAASAAHRVIPWLTLAALFAVALVMRQVLAPNTDVSWLLTAAERILHGQRLYIDVIETNPPMAVLTYVPGVAIARLLGVPAEMVVDGLVFAAALLSLAVAARILKASGRFEEVAGWPFALLAFAILTILPAHTFGQREHIVVIELLPLIALYAVRMRGGSPPAWAVLIGGIGAGLAMSFKPHFALGVFFGAVVSALYARSWRLIFGAENWIAAAVVAVYWVCVVRFYPEYLSGIVPLVRDVYLQVGMSLGVMIVKPGVLIWAAAIVASLILKRSGRIDGPLLLLLAISFGFMLAFFLQRRGWPYHSYPAIAFAMLGLGYALVTGLPRALYLLGITMMAIAFFQSVVWFNDAFDARPLWGPVARLGPHPRILALTAEPGIGHPMVRALQGTWVSRQQGLWVAGYLRYLRSHGQLDPQQEAAISPHIARERAMLIEDIRKTEPTVVVVDNLTDHWSEWLAENPDIADLLRDYRTVANLEGIEIRAKLP